MSTTQPNQLSNRFKKDPRCEFSVPHYFDLDLRHAETKMEDHVEFFNWFHINHDFHAPTILTQSKKNQMLPPKKLKNTTTSGTKTSRNNQL